ncbi:AAA family ATPase [Colwellia asteriadis]|uniref:AAA family ATPase n=1 Tax=Colwellia asteriadis TaxID=517723 RepID=A0ABP3WEA0_9GAMM
MGIITRTTIQVTSVHVGTFGGAIFGGKDTKKNTRIRCVASYKILTRSPQIGEFWYIEGSSSRSEEYGIQIRLTKCAITDLPSPSYLSSLLINHPMFRGFGLGKNKVNKLIRGVGCELELIKLLDESKYLHLADIISEPIAKTLCECWTPLQNEMQLAKFLTEHNISPYMSKQISKICHENAVNRLISNPYALLAFAPTSPKLWSTVETIASKLEIPRDAPQRLVGAVEHSLYTALRSGDTAMTKNELVTHSEKLLGSHKRAELAIHEACKIKAICSFQTSTGLLKFQTFGAAVIESSLEKLVAELVKEPLQLSINAPEAQRIINKYSSDFIKLQGYSLTNEQLNAIRMVFDKRISVITGYGGSGKTTVLRAIADIAEKLGFQPYLTALAGKAKDRIEQATGRSNESFTIHGFIKQVKEGSEYVNLSGTPIIIIDEASMVDIALANRLLSLLSTTNYHLVLVGDPAQLSPIGFGLFFHVLVDSVCTQKLTKVHRQTADSPIHKMAMKVRNGEHFPVPKWEGQDHGVYIVECNPEQKDIIKKLTDTMQRQRCQIITPHASLSAADNTSVINNAMQFVFNSPKINDYTEANGYEYSRPVVRLGDTVLMQNDPVIVTVNNFSLGLYNGNTGVVEEILNKNGQDCVNIRFDGVSRLLTKENCFELGIELAYAITIHKSQGSEYNAIIVCCAVPSKLLERSMVYTALTRSKNLTIFVGSNSMLVQAIKNQPRASTINHGFLPEIKS